LIRAPQFELRFYGATSKRPLADLMTTQSCNAIAFKLGSTEGPALDGSGTLIDALNHLRVIPQCRARQFRSTGYELDLDISATFSFVATSRQLCQLDGYPRLTFRDNRGARLAIGGNRAPNSRPSPIDITPGATLSFAAHWQQPPPRCPDPPASLAVALPSDLSHGEIPIAPPVTGSRPWPCNGRIALYPWFSLAG
jgi:hypothetical protein